MGTPVNARVAVSSLWLASAAAVGFNMPPARETDWTAAIVLVAVLAGGGVTTAVAEDADETVDTIIGLLAGVPMAAPPMINNYMLY